MLSRGNSVLIAFAISLAACGSTDESVQPTEDGLVDGASDGEIETMADDEMADGDVVDMGEMNMGDINANPADEVADAELQTGSFELLETRPSGYDDLTGSAAIARSPAGTTVTIELLGLESEVDYIAHVHSGECSTTSAHYMFDPDGPTTPPNEIHLAFTSDVDGAGAMTAENHSTAGPEGRSVIIHRSDLLDNKIACAQFS